MPGIGVLYNPKSGRHRRDPDAAVRLSRALGDHGVLRAASSFETLSRAAEDFKELGIDVLGISGGDGTNSVTIRGFLDVYQGSALPQLAFLRGGTMNTAANAVGIRRGPPEGLLGRLVQAYVTRASQPLENVERHVLKLQCDTGNEYGFVFGTGVVCGYLAEYYRGGPPNPVIAAKTLARGIGSAMVGGEMIRRMAAPFRGSVELADGVVWPEHDYLAIAGGTIDQIGLNFRPFHRYAEQPSSFHVLGIHTSPMGFVTQLPRIWRAAPMKPERALEAVTSRITIRSPNGPFRYMVDGDLHTCSGPLTVSTGPKVRIVVGT
jgi:diacylglycerol kinase family enzyme